MGENITLEALQYDLQGLYTAIDKCDINVGIFEKAIEDERARKGRFQQMAAVLEIKEARMKEEAGV